MQRELLPEKASSAFKHIFRLYLLIWSILVVIAVTLVVRHDLNWSMQEFAQTNKLIADHVTERMLVAETALEAFSAFISNRESLNHRELSLFAANLLQRYPFLYMFEVAEKVSHTQLAELETNLGKYYPGFYVRRFDYEVSRKWQPVGGADFYYPIIFQEPFFTDKRNILGLDLYASDFLLEAMRKSNQQGIPVATRPFVLVEDQLGYVIHRAIGGKIFDQSQPLTMNRYALLALVSDSLFSNIVEAADNFSVVLQHGSYQTAGGANPVVLEKIKLQGTALEKKLLPLLTFEKDLSEITPSQPFILVTEWQLTWKDFSYRLIGIILLIWIVIPLVSKKFAFQYFENRLDTMETDGTLFYLANYDALTGIPNRHRLLDHLETMILRAKRDKAQFKVFFIDLDNLKPINDEYGHAAGDFLLIELCNRIADHVRHDEMLARFGGDEFVLVSNTYHDELETDEVIERLKQQLVRPISYKGKALQVSMSIGSATYPVDGRNLSALLEKADQRMYEDKKRSKQKSA